VTNDFHPDKFDLTRFIRPNVVDLKPYTPILPFEVLSAQLERNPADIIKLDANENPYGPSPLVAQALAEAPFLHIYPDPDCR
jgi:histidinol-phosphate aminotransferase